MRYYRVVLTKPDGSVYQFKSAAGAFDAGSTLTSLLPSGPQDPRTGLTNPAALQVELDVAVANLADPDNNQGAAITVWGLGLQDVGNTADLNGLNVAVYGGMAAGLPLANPAQAGLLVSGQVFQAFGNWEGANQTVNIVLAQGGDATGVADGARNFPFTMRAGTTLGDAVKATLSVALPGVPVVLNVSPDLTTNRTESGHYGSFARFAAFIKDFSAAILGGGYGGVVLTLNGASVVGFDGLGATSTKSPTAIAFQDLIGQPTWIGPGTVSVRTVMRADIRQGDYVTLPQTLFTQSTAANQRFLANPQNRLTFSGQFQVQQVHHYGASRQPDAASWNTTYQVTPQQAAPATNPSNPAP